MSGNVIKMEIAGRSMEVDMERLRADLDALEKLPGDDLAAKMATVMAPSDLVSQGAAVEAEPMGPSATQCDSDA